MLKRRSLNHILIATALLFGVLASLFAVVLLAKARWMESPQLQVKSSDLPVVDTEALTKRLLASFTVPTISASSAEGENLPMRLQRAWKKHYPRTFKQLNLTSVGNRSMILHWPAGSEPSGSRVGKPIMLLTHFDVAAVQAERWAKQPFAGVVKEGQLWARGAKDGKYVAVALLESVEQLLKTKFSPRRDIYIVLTEDGELGGETGAAGAAEWFVKNKIEFEFVLAPGGFITQGLMPDVDGWVALIGTAEKTVLQVKLSVQGEAGPAAMAHDLSAMSRLGAALAKLETAERSPMLTPPMRGFYAALGHAAPLKKRVQIANGWLFEDKLAENLAALEYSAATVQEAIAVVRAESGKPGNAQAKSASALVSVYILPEQSASAVLGWMRAAIDDDTVSVEPVPRIVSKARYASTDSPAYWQLAQTLREIFPDVQVAPYMSVAATDARYFVGLADNIYRFVPQPIAAKEVAQIHGPDERLDLDAMARGIFFYANFIRRVGM